MSYDLKTSKPYNSVNNSSHEVFRFKSYIENSDPNDEAASDSDRKLFNYRSLSNKFNNSLRNQEKQTRLPTSESLISSLRHTKTAKSKKKDKEEFQRKLEKKYNNNVECYNLIEKEKFRLLLAQNCGKPARCSGDSFGQKNVYKQYIHSSPTKTRDDSQGFNRFDMDKLHLPVSSVPPQVSRGYSRRISLSLDSKPTSLLAGNNNCSFLNKYTNGVLKNSSNYNSLSNNALNNTKHSKNIIEIDITNDSFKKSAQKRPNQSIVKENDDKMNMEQFRKEKKDYYDSHYNRSGLNGASNGYSKLNRSQNEFEKNINERLSKNQHIIEAVLKKSQSKVETNLLIEEERYKLKKRQRLEKEKIEKDLALKFSQQLHLDSNKLSGIFLQEDLVCEEENDFPELEEDQLARIENALVSSPPDEVLVSAFSISVTRRDISTLKGLNWLNDEIINFYMSLICERSKESPGLAKVHAFTTFFYPKLIKDGYSALKRWTRKIDVFSYDFIIVPLHLGLHWTLAVIDFNCREIRYYDSMNGNNGECLKALKNYLFEEHKDKKGSPIDLSNWNCLHMKNLPQQMNGSDCGMFACKYAEYVSRGKTVFNFNQSNIPYFRRRMIWEILNTKLM